MVIIETALEAHGIHFSPCAHAKRSYQGATFVMQQQRYKGMIYHRLTSHAVHMCTRKCGEHWFGVSVTWYRQTNVACIRKEQTCCMVDVDI